MPMSALTAVEKEVVHALEDINVPSYLIDAAGVIRWVNRAARRLVGDVEGRQFTSVVAHEDTGRVRELFARKLLGNTESADSPIVLVDVRGERVAVELSSAPLHARWPGSTRQIADDVWLVMARVRKSRNDLALLLREVETIVAETGLQAIRYHVDGRAYVLAATAVEQAATA